MIIKDRKGKGRGKRPVWLQTVFSWADLLRQAGEHLVCLFLTHVCNPHAPYLRDKSFHRKVTPRQQCQTLAKTTHNDDVYTRTGTKVDEQLPSKVSSRKLYKWIGSKIVMFLTQLSSWKADMTMSLTEAVLDDTLTNPKSESELWSHNRDRRSSKRVNAIPLTVTLISAYWKTSSAAEKVRETYRLAGLVPQLLDGSHS